MEYKIGDYLYLRTYTDQNERAVTSICINPGNIQYQLACGASTSWHYEFELTIEKNILLTSSN